MKLKRKIEYLKHFILLKRTAKIKNCFTKSLLSIAMAFSLISPSLSSVTAQTDLSLWQGLTSSFDDGDTKTEYALVGNVDASYSAKAEVGAINNYHLTAWHKVKKSDSIDKSYNDGRGNYYGFSQEKISAYKQYETEIRALNNGDFPKSPLTLPMDTSLSSTKLFFDKAGYYDIHYDTRYSNVVLNGFVTYNWKEKETVTTKIRKSSSGGQTFTSTAVDNDELNRIYNRVNLKCGTNVDFGKYYASAAKNGSYTTTVKSNGKEVTFTMTYNRREVTGTTGAAEIEIGLSATSVEEKKTTKILERTQKVQIASTTVATNKYASELNKYNKFYLVPLGTTHNISTSEKGFWKNVTPYYFTTNNDAYDNGNYSYTFSNGVDSGLASAQINVYGHLDTKDAYFNNLADKYYKIPDEICTVGSCSNPEIPQNPDTPNIPNNPDNNPSNPNNKGDDESYDDNKSNIKEDNQPFVSVIVDVKNPDDSQLNLGLKKFVHLTKDN